jgi:universal stress protein A
MQTYGNILIALELEGSEGYLLEAAKNVASDQARFSFIHVFQAPIYPADSYLGDIPLRIREEEISAAKQKFAELAQRYGLSDVGQTVLVGRAASEIHRAAAESEADLIVVGSHGRHGIQLLLGSTANAVLHGAGCDVLAVRMKATDA